MLNPWPSSFDNAKYVDDENDKYPVVHMSYAGIEDTIMAHVWFIQLNEGFENDDDVPDIDKLTEEFMSPENLKLMHEKYEEWEHEQVCKFVDERRNVLSTKYNLKWDEKRGEYVSSKQTA
jgi:hypothetical protein